MNSRRIAERRALSWMRAVCEMFWDQCKLGLFMYGMFEDKNGDFRGVVCVHLAVLMSVAHFDLTLTEQVRHHSDTAQGRSQHPALPGHEGVGPGLPW